MPANYASPPTRTNVSPRPPVAASPPLTPRPVVPVPPTRLPAPPPPSAPGWALTWATTLILVAGILHLVLAPSHLAEARGQGIFFILLAIAQVGWAITYLRGPSKGSYLAGLAVMVVMPIVAYVGSRIITPPFSDGPEGWDIIGAATLVAEVGAGILLAFHGLRSGFAWTRPRLAPAPLLVAALAAGLVLAGAVYGLGMAAGATTHWLNEPEAGHHSGAEAPPDHHSATDPSPLALPADSGTDRPVDSAASPLAMLGAGEP